MIPLLIAGAVIGLGAHACASVDNDEAREKNRCANEIIDESKRIAQEAKNLCQGSIDTLAKEKTRILQGNMRRFVSSFSQIKPVNFSDTGDLFEIDKFNKNELTTMQAMVSSVQKVTVNDVVGGVSGTALAVGAADVLAGGSILGGTGMSMSVGGLAGGAALGAIAAPIFAISGIFSASEASANLEKAKSNLSKARAYQDECETYSYLAQTVSERCDMFYETLYNINITWFNDAVNQLERLVNSKKTFGNSIKNILGKKIYTRQEMQMVASAASLAKMVKTIIDTNILDNNGHVTEESERVILEIQDKINTDDLTVRVPESEAKDQVLYQQQQGVYQQQPVYQQRGVYQQQPVYRQQSVYQQQGVYQQQPVYQQRGVYQQQPVYQQQGVYQQQPVYQQQGVCQQQVIYQQQASNVPKANNKKAIYNPNGFVKLIMWVHTIFYVILGLLIIIGGSFICGVTWFAAGLMMCPKLNVTMRFWPRFGLMMLLLVVGFFLICV